MSKPDADDRLYRMRHSLAHILAQAMQTYRPGTKLGFGPATEDGFYYDFILPEPIGEEDLPKIQKVMEGIVKERQPFQHEEVSVADGLKRLAEMGEPYKAEHVERLVGKRGLTELSFYSNGPFVDMCEGPHLEDTGRIPKGAFKLHAISTAYWLGDEKNQSLTRVRGYAFLDKKELKAYLKAREEAKLRDHRKLGAELDLYVINEEIGKGLPLWLPNGAVLCEELEKLAGEWEFQDGYLPVRTPHLTRGSLYKISGHLDLYKEGMFPGMAVDDDDGEGGGNAAEDAFYLKPMNCPHHHMIYAARPRSYRDLPLRLAEYGTVYRYERSGTLQGLTRVRGMAMNDAHIYITEDQIKDEFLKVMDLHKRYYELFGFSDYYMRLSTWDPDDPKGKQKYVDDPESWAFSQDRVREAMQDSGIPFQEVMGEAAFYGPKIDIQFKTVGLKEFTVSTNQLDFAVPKRFNAYAEEHHRSDLKMVYTDSDGQEKTPYVIHRAPLSTHERFVSFLIEHYGGAFPTWLAPVQVRILPLSEKHVDYADRVEAALRSEYVRAEVDRSGEKLGKKIKLGSLRKIPILLIVGAQEEADETVNVRRLGLNDQRAFKLAEFQDLLRAEIAQRKHVQSWDDVEALRS